MDGHAPLALWCQQCGARMELDQEIEGEVGLVALDPEQAPDCRCGARRWMNVRPWHLSAQDRKALRQLYIKAD